MDDAKYWKRFYSRENEELTEEKPALCPVLTEASVKKCPQGNFYAVVLVGPMDCPDKAQSTAAALKLFNEAPSI